MREVVVDITEWDIEQFKRLVYSDGSMGDDSMEWIFQDDKGEAINIIFVKGNEDG